MAFALYCPLRVSQKHQCEAIVVKSCRHILLSMQSINVAGLPVLISLCTYCTEARVTQQLFVGQGTIHPKVGIFSFTEPDNGAFPGEYGALHHGNSVRAY